MLALEDVVDGLKLCPFFFIIQQKHTTCEILSWRLRIRDILFAKGAKVFSHHEIRKRICLWYVHITRVLVMGMPKTRTGCPYHSYTGSPTIHVNRSVRLCLHYIYWIAAWSLGVISWSIVRAKSGRESGRENAFSASISRWRNSSWQSPGITKLKTPGN